MRLECLGSGVVTFDDGMSSGMETSEVEEESLSDCS